MDQQQQLLLLGQPDLRLRSSLSLLDEDTTTTTSDDVPSSSRASRDNQEQDDQHEDAPAVPSRQNSSSSSEDDDEEGLVDYDTLKERNTALRERLKQLQAQRQRVAVMQHRLDEAKSKVQYELLNQHNSSNTHHHQQQPQDDSLLLRQVISNQTALCHLQNDLFQTQHWNVLANDCFHINTEQQTATINGLRLGAVAVVVGNTASQQQQQSGSTTTDITTTTISTTTTSTSIMMKVPWREINAALGQTALLLTVLEQHLGDGMLLLKYEIQALGSTSKIGLRTTTSSSSSTTTTTTFYNLYYEEQHALSWASFFVGKRHFSTALQYLLLAVHNATELLQQHLDRTIVVPHPVIDATAASSVPTIGGLPITIQNNNENWTEWTRAMKYLLTNLKHLMVYRAVGLWDNTT